MDTAAVLESRGEAASNSLSGHGRSGHPRRQHTSQKARGPRSERRPLRPYRYKPAVIFDFSSSVPTRLWHIMQFASIVARVMGLVLLCTPSVSRLIRPAP